jgi:hypothetical protein
MVSLYMLCSSAKYGVKSFQWMHRKIQEQNWPGIALSVEDCSMNPVEAEVWSIEHLHYPLHALNKVLWCADKCGWVG